MPSTKLAESYFISKEFFRKALGKHVDFTISSACLYGSYSNSCDYSPASAELSVAVGATTSADYEVDFSNNGPCMTLYAPGVDIISTNPGGGTSIKSGETSRGLHMCFLHDWTRFG